jgi:hypothetical protein
MTALSHVLAWKFNDAHGIRTRETSNGLYEIFDWPEADLGPEPTQAQLDTWTAEYEALDHKAIEAEMLLGRAIDLTFLDGFWLVFKAIAPVGNASIDNAVAANDRAAFDIFFRDIVKGRIP